MEPSADLKPAAIEKYGQRWKVGSTPVEIEMACIRQGGRWKNKAGNQCGEGLFHHYKALQMILWPDDYHHRWSDLELSEILNNTITVCSGPKDTGKTRVALVRYGLTDYFCFPEETLIIVSSTTLSALELRVWGDMKSLFQRAKSRFPGLPGNVLESKHAIVTDNLDDKSVMSRDMRRGIVCVPCKLSSGTVNGISAYVGIKQKRRRHLGDEFQFMHPSMMDSIANMNSGDYKGVFTGNPIGQGDPLDQMSEPKGGWDNFPEPTETTVYDNQRFLGSRTIVLYGPDSPNFDDPEQPNKYPGLINADSIARVVAGYSKDSNQYYSQCLGVRKTGLDAHRVITRSMVLQFHGFDQPIWSGSPRTKIGGLDAAYGGIGGDRCIGGHIEFGMSVDGNMIIGIVPPVIVPVSVKKTGMPEDQISDWSKSYCETHGITPENWFYDSTGKGSLGPSLARIWSTAINPVEFGGVPTDRPVSNDFWIIDPKTGQKRLKTCREHYSKFVTELWYSTRYALEANQIRGMTEELCREGSSREWLEVAGNKIEVETKADMKTRVGYSPDFYDWLCICVEGARRRGFQIAKLQSTESTTKIADFMADLRNQSKDLRKYNNLKAA